MQVDTAMALIGQVIYKPGWSFECHNHCNRFEGTITIKALTTRRRTPTATKPTKATPKTS